MKSRTTAISALLILTWCATHTHALEGHVLMGTAFVNDGLQGVYICHLEDGSYERLVTGNADGARFSPDGKKIAYHQGGRLHVMDNDGGNDVQLMASGCTPGRGEMSYSTNGIFWSDDAVIQRWRFDTGEHEILYDVNTLGTSTSHAHKDQGFWVSSDGHKGYLYVHMDDETLPIVEFNNDFTDVTFTYTAIWGHGNTVTPNGAYVLMNWWETGHTSLRVWSIDENRQVDTADCGLRIVNWASLENCANSNDWAVIRVEDTHLYVVDWAHDQTPIQVVTPDVTESGGVGKRPGNMWLGALPVPVDGPYLALNDSELQFSAAGSQDVVVTNTGTGTLSTLTVDITPASAWLSTSVAGGGTNTQTITATVDPAGLADGVHEADIVVSGGGASNTVTCHVVLTVGSALAAPSGVQADATGAELKDVSLTWTDNTSSETGFVIERKPEDGAWEVVDTTAADAVSYTDANRPYGVYLYRVKAVNGSLESTYSNEATVTVLGVPWLTITAPDTAQTLTGGDTVTIQWDANLIPTVEIKYSLDAAETWVVASDTGGISDGEASWSNFTWVVPNVATTELFLTVHDYGVPTSGDILGPYTIVENPDAAVAPRAMHAPAQAALSASGGSDGIVARLRLGATQHGVLEIYSVAGELVRKWRVSRGATRLVSAAVPHGAYLIRLTVLEAGRSPDVRTLRVVCR